jgi:hypothetical protein
LSFLAPRAFFWPAFHESRAVVKVSLTAGALPEVRFQVHVPNCRIVGNNRVRPADPTEEPAAVVLAPEGPQERLQSGVGRHQNASNRQVLQSIYTGRNARANTPSILDRIFLE